MTDERAFLTAILERPDDDATKLVYADWLEEQGDPRAEYLRLMMTVRRGGGGPPAERERDRGPCGGAGGTPPPGKAARGDGCASPGGEGGNREAGRAEEMAELSGQIRQQVPGRLRELAAVLDPNWLAVVSDPEIEQCGRGTSGFWRLQFDFVCDRTWADMTPIGDAGVRRCEACSKNVYFC